MALGLTSALTSARVCQVSCGAFHTLSVTTDGTVYAWGSGKDGKLGLTRNLKTSL